ncbi:hypothetical protein MATL_G00000810 [Megalops atlanticus]|uniref:C-type lectin domain-containing protein n=1 Tax=Megalops atlanticus TaxID=7932 RepID=A0A9D3TGV0_MEGAT|nr:hypothetical protein MATL_G00000810 [Megalops atlanticus]
MEKYGGIVSFYLSHSVGYPATSLPFLRATLIQPTIKHRTGRRRPPHSLETMRVLTIAVLLCTALALPAATGETEESEEFDCEEEKKDVTPTQGGNAVTSPPEFDCEEEKEDVTPTQGQTEKTEGPNAVTSPPGQKTEGGNTVTSPPEHGKYVTSPPARCPAGWKEFKSRCFLFVNEAKSWIYAEVFCIQQGGHLASVHSSSENLFIQMLNVPHSLRPSWVGGRDSVTEGHWEWIDKSGFYYTQWNSGEPNDLNHAEDCLCINWRTESLGWNDYNCDKELPFVCARRL